MKKIFVFLGYLLFWYLFFVLARISFILYHWGQSSQLSFIDILNTFRYGFALDISISAYLSLIPGLLLTIVSIYPKRSLILFLKYYTLITLIISTGIVIIDLNLYSYWGFRLDATPLFYMKNLKAMTASLSLWVWIGGLLLIAVISFLVFRIFWRTFKKFFSELRRQWTAALISLLLSLLLVYPIRGGFGISSLTISSAYFSQNQYANHVAINPVWNFAFSVTESKDLEKEYKYFSQDSMMSLVRPLISKEGKPLPVLNTRRPNIILVIVESLTAKAVGVTGGIKGITPRIDSLAHQGILFDHVIAGSDRTDKGLAAVIAGYHSLPGSTPLKFQKLTQKLPFMPARLSKEGYSTSFYYGGTLEFANYRSFLVQAGYRKLISDIDFKPEEMGSKWGAWDHEVFRYFLNDTPDKSEQFFSTILTLTSHEPFTIPIPPLLKGSDSDTKFLNSLHYTDKAIGDFVEEASKKDWWKNTLMIIIADHGSPMPGNSGNEEYGRQHIPMIWLGGALRVRDTVIHQVCSQTDIAATLLSQLGIDNRDFLFSKDILSDKPDNFAFYTFNDGFCFRSDKDELIFNTVTQKYKKVRTDNPLLQLQAKAYLQLLYSNFFKGYK